MVHKVREELTGANRENWGTFKGWVLDGLDKVGIQLESPSVVQNSLVELETEIVYVTSVDANSGVATCPPWFRQQLGTPANDSFAVDSRVTINPIWRTYRLAEKIVEGIESLHPALFAVKEVDLTSSSVNGNYEIVDTTIDSVIKVTWEQAGAGAEQIPVNAYSLDSKNADSKVYLRMYPLYSGRPLRVTYRAKPTIPDPANLDATWASTGLPDSADDLPVKYAWMCLLPTIEAAKTQTVSVEQSDRNRFVQGGSGNAASRRMQEIYQARLMDERRKLIERYPTRTARAYG